MGKNTVKGKDESGRRVLGEGKHLRLIDANGWEMVERRNISGIVVLIAMTIEGELVLVEQERPPVGARVIELPAGLAGDLPGSEDEALLGAAQRELLEETGYASDDWQAVTAGPVSPGLSNEVITLFLARNAVRVGEGGGDEHEDIEVHVVPLAHAATWLEQRRLEGTAVDPKVYAGLYFAERSARTAVKDD